MADIEKLEALTSKPSWNDEDDEAIPHAEWEEARALLKHMEEIGLAEPIVSPCGDGSIHFAWKVATGGSFIIERKADKTVATAISPLAERSIRWQGPLHVALHMAQVYMMGAGYWEGKPHDRAAKQTPEQHKARHVELHGALDELFAFTWWGVEEYGTPDGPGGSCKQLEVGEGWKNWFVYVEHESWP